MPIKEAVTKKKTTVEHDVEGDKREVMPIINTKLSPELKRK